MIDLSIYECLSIIGGISFTSFSAGYFLGKKLNDQGESADKTSTKPRRKNITIKKQCDTLSQNKKSPIYAFYDIEITYKKGKAITNTCQALQGKICKYTQETCYLL